MESRPHILFISSWYPNRNNPTHGIFNLHFVQAAALHHKVSVIHICSEHGLKQNVEMLTEQMGRVSTHTVYTKKITLAIPFISQWLKRSRMIKAYNLAFECVTRERGLPQLIHLNVVLPAGLGVLHLHKKHKIPFVVNEGWTGYMKADGSYNGFLVKYLTKRIINAAAFILPVSKDLEEAMKSHGLNGRYKIIPNVIQTTIFDIRSSSSLALDTAEGPSFIHVSTFDPKQKNVIGILRAFKKALEKSPYLNLMLVGDNENKSDLLDFVKRNALENQVHFKGKMNSEELAVLFNHCQALIMFSNYESFGVVIGEALACGLPVICSKTGGLAGSINDNYGIVIKENNEEELCSAILSIADKTKIFEKGVLRKFITESYSETIVAMELKKVYGEVLTTNQ